MNLYLWVSPSAKVDVMYRQLCICVGMHLIVVMLFVVWVDTNPVRVGEFTFGSCNITCTWDGSNTE